MRAVFFDLDNTLIHRRHSIDRYAEHFLRDHPHPAGEHAALAACIAHADQGGYLPEGWPHPSVKLSVSHAITGLPPWCGLAVDGVLAHWTQHFPVCAVAMPGAQTLVEWLAALGTYVGVISNGAAHSREASIAALPFRAHIRQILSSSEIGMNKPDPRVFATAAERAGIPLDDCWYVGDHPRNDVVGARDAGMRSIWLQGFHAWPDGLAPCEYAADSLDGVRALLEKHRAT